MIKKAESRVMNKSAPKVFGRVEDAVYFAYRPARYRIADVTGDINFPRCAECSAVDSSTVHGKISSSRAKANTGIERS